VTDVSIEPTLRRAFIEKLCVAGQIVDYHECADRNHMGITTANSPAFPTRLKWTERRFAGQSPGEACSFARQ
jgi:hypothetical protein